MEEQFLPFLNARCRGAGDYQVHRRQALGEAAVASQETDALQLLPVGFFERAQHVA